MMNIDRKARRGVVWTGIEKILVYGISFAQGIVLARLLGPEDFGLTAMLGIFLVLGGLLAESGLGTALVVYGGSRSLERKVFKWNIGLAGALYSGLVIAAPLIGSWFAQPQLVSLVRALGTVVIINALSVVGTARLTRQLKFDVLASINAGSTIFAAGVAILLAWNGCGVWSIAIMGVVSVVIRTSLILVVARGGTEETRGSEAPFGELLRYGWKMMTSGIISVLSSESYNFVIGKLWSAGAVGLFARGQRWAKLPGEVVNESVGRVALPVLAGSATGGEKRWRWSALNVALLWPGLVVLWIWAEEIVAFVLGAQWIACVPYMRILIVGQFFTPISNLALTRLKAAGRADLVLKTDFIKKPIGIAALLAGLPFGVTGLCWAKVMDDIVEAAVDALVVRRMGK